MQKPVLYSPKHIEKASPVIKLIIYIMGFLSALCIIGGLIGIIWNSYSPTQIKILGADISTGHVGVAFTALGIISMLFVSRSVLKHIHLLGQIRER